MKKRTYSIMAAALLLMAGALQTTGCSSDDAAIENATPSVGSETIIFTATLAPKGDDGGQTRAITPGTDGEDKEILNVAWAAGEEIAVYYQKTNGKYATVKATVGTPNADGSAPITATLSSPMDGGTVKFVYPYTLRNLGDIKTDKLFNDQVGTLADISANFDAATGSGTISTAAGTAVVSDKVTLTNRVCICKFHFSYKNAYNADLTLTAFDRLRIITPDGIYTVNTSTTGDIYVAMLPCTGADITFIADVSFSDGFIGGNGFFTAFPTGVTLSAGKFYRSLPITLKIGLGTGHLKNLSAGSITAADGDMIIQTVSDVTANTITIPDGVTVTLAGVDIEATASSGIICNGSANINLLGTNSVRTSQLRYPAVLAGGSGTTLTFNGSGRLWATGANYGAGIGSGSSETPFGTCGNIVINGGRLNVTGGESGAGIGSGQRATCGNITINGGIITTEGGRYAAGIGSGEASSFTTINSICGAITISGGTIDATGGWYAAGIGSGRYGQFGSINIGSGITSLTATTDNVTGPQVPIGMGQYDKGSGSVTIDGTTTWTAGTATTHLNFTSESNYGGSGFIWTLTPKD